MPWLTWLMHVVATNQFAQAAMVGGPVTAASIAARRVPGKIYGAIKRFLTVEVTFLSDMSDYQAMQRFISQHVAYDRMSRNFTYQTESNWNSDAESYETKHHGLAIGFGTHLGFYKHRLAIIGRYKEEASATSQFKERTEVTFLARRKSLVLEFAEDVKRLAGTSEHEFTSVPIYLNSGSYWSRAGKLPLRSMDTVFTSGDSAGRILRFLSAFNSKREEHHRLGLPHHAGVLLYGPPGTGKTSLIHAIASALGRSIYYLNLGSVDSDQQLTDLVASGRDWSRSILVLEDFDTAGANTSRGHLTAATIDAETGGIMVAPTDDSTPKEKKPVTLSALLNILDGLIAPDGLMTIATTNHPERLDPALRRPGRFDISVELGLLGAGEMRRMAALFGKDIVVANDFTPITGAEMRQRVLEAA